jgi:hypothetical protein
MTHITLIIVTKSQYTKNGLNAQGLVVTVAQSTLYTTQDALAEQTYLAFFLLDYITPYIRVDYDN